jgi:hypothetical protein
MKRGVFAGNPAAWQTATRRHGARIKRHCRSGDQTRRNAVTTGQIWHVYFKSLAGVVVRGRGASGAWINSSSNLTAFSTLLANSSSRPDTAWISAIRMSSNAGISTGAARCELAPLNAAILSVLRPTPGSLGLASALIFDGVSLRAAGKFSEAVFH